MRGRLTSADTKLIAHQMPYPFRQPSASPQFLRITPPISEPLYMAMMDPVANPKDVRVCNAVLFKKEISQLTDTLG